MKYKIQFKNVNDLEDFVKRVGCISCDVNLYDGHKYLDAKSLMALMNLDLRKSFFVEFMTDDEVMLEKCQHIVKGVLV